MSGFGDRFSSWWESYGPTIVEVGVLLGGLFLSYILITGLLRILNNKIPTINLEGGWIRYILDGPKSVLVVGLISVLIGVLVINTEAATQSIGIKLLGIVFTEFGFAFFIAFILHNTIEMHSRLEHDKQISRGIISYLYGVRLDDKMFKAAEDHIFKSHFYRKNMRVEYDFVSIKAGAVLLKHSLEYEVVNLSEQRQTFEVQTWVEKSSGLCGEWDNVPERLGLHRISINGQSISAEDLDAARKVQQDDENFLQSSHPVELDANGSALIKTVSFLEKCERDTEFWRSLFPADGVEVRFTWRPEMDLEVQVDAIHPSGQFDGVPHSEAGLVEAKLSQPLFPYNGFLFWWSNGTASGSKG